MPVILTAEQREAIATLDSRTRLHHRQTFGGLAGTGKTVCVRELKRRNPSYAVAAFTGKAANVLRRKGVPASTIHSLIYKAVEVIRTDATGKEWKETTFVRRKPAELACDGFLIDEASMVTKKLHDDLLSYGRPVIFVGDHGQLPPVGDDFSLMESPDIRLETIHRNAGEIAHFANFLRQGNEVGDWAGHELATNSAVRVCDYGDLPQIESEPDQWICAFNRTRVALNRFCRRSLGYPDDTPVIGDRVMCLQNSNDFGVFNGQQGIVNALWPDNEFIFATDQREYRLRYRPEQFNNLEKPKFSHGPKLPFDYCYCITCHKAQGDEWPHVLVIEERCDFWDHSRWAYTAASRAKEQLTWIAA